MHSEIFIVSFFDLVMIYRSSEFYTVQDKLRVVRCGAELTCRKSVVTPYKPAAIMPLKTCLYRQQAEHL
ncbi:hypothetical protein PAXRUDRAFT_836261, partial [Paxillus rubicundulus Ve08.2h10]